MKINFRYDDEFQTIELTAEDLKGKWINISIEDVEGKSPEEQEQIVQEAIDVMYNRLEYNNWHKHDRHNYSFDSIFNRNGEIRESDNTEASFRRVKDKAIFYKDMDACEERIAYQEYCDWVRKVLAKKPAWADMFISICMDGESIRDYAARTGNNENNITHKLKRAKKKLREAWPETSRKTDDEGRE